MQQIKLKKAFTLVELLLALFLMGLLAVFVFSQPGVYKKKEVKVTIANLPETFQNTLVGNGELVCVNKCSECYYLTDSKKVQNTPLPMPFKVTNEYILDKNNNPIKIEMGRFNDKKVCMRLKHYKNNSISPVILEVKGEYIYLPSYFGEGKKFDSLNEAVSYWVRNSEGKFRSKSEWY